VRATFGVAWQPNKRLLFGFRALFNNDLERRTDATGTVEGLARSVELKVRSQRWPKAGVMQRRAPLTYAGVQLKVRVDRLARHNAEMLMSVKVLPHPSSR
jgi:hypothetical protein